MTTAQPIDWTYGITQAPSKFHRGQTVEYVGPEQPLLSILPGQRMTVSSIERAGGGTVLYGRWNDRQLCFREEDGRAIEPQGDDMKKRKTAPAVADDGPTTLQEQLLTAIEQSGLSRYRIAKETGIDYYSFSRFLDERRDVRLSTVEALADYFGMRFTAAKKPKS